MERRKVAAFRSADVRCTLQRSHGPRLQRKVVKAKDVPDIQVGELENLESDVGGGMEDRAESADPLKSSTPCQATDV